ncbi:MAG TPA: effector-associated domain EAD1-containing protein, partial [Chroococcidiopsis sp.]
MVIDWNDNTNRSMFREALQNAYPSEEALELFVDEELNENLAAIAQGNLQALAFGLIKWARSRGTLDEVYGAFKRHNPKHPVIEVLERQAVVSPNSNLTGGEGDRLQTSPPPSPPQTETTPANLAPEVFVSYAWGGE